MLSLIADFDLREVGVAELIDRKRDCGVRFQVKGLGSEANSRTWVDSPSGSGGTSGRGLLGIRMETFLRGHASTLTHSFFVSPPT